MFVPKEYQYETPYRGKPKAAFDSAKSALLSLGFEITKSTDNTLEAKGPGMQSNRQPALLGVSLLRLKIDAGAITATAVLGGVATMKAFVYLFPPALALFLLLTFWLLGMGLSWVYAAWVLPWFVIAPWMSGLMERSTTNAIDRLVRGMAQA